jgi:regulator of sigma E protease
MTGTMVVQTLSFLGRLISGEVSTVHVSGPVGIVKYTQATIARGGFSIETAIRILSLMALISVNLAVVNLLPIPIADGGQLLFFFFEGIRGRPLAVKWQVGIQQVSVLVLIGLFALVTLKDLVYW